MRALATCPTCPTGCLHRQQRKRCQVVAPPAGHWHSGWRLRLRGCATAPPPPTEPVPARPPRPGHPGQAHPCCRRPSPRLPSPVGPVSLATTPRAYRVDAASHLYGPLHRSHLSRASCRRCSTPSACWRWTLTPRAGWPICAGCAHPARPRGGGRDRTLGASPLRPYPAPLRMGRVTYTDTWLWHKSGKLSARHPRPRANAARAS